MRKIFTLSALFIVCAASAQLEKGTWNINAGTNALLNLRLQTNGPGFSSYDFTVNPGVGYFIKDRWEIGGGPLVTFGGSRYNSPGSSPAYEVKSAQRSLGFNIYSRYYLKKQGKLIPYVTVNGSYKRTTAWSIYNGNKNTYHSNDWQVGAGAGVNWFIAPRVALFGELSYTGNFGSGAGYNSGAEFKIGFQIFLNRKKSK